LYSGGTFNDQNPNYGPFTLNGNPADNANPAYGARNLVKFKKKNVVWLFRTPW